MIKGVLAIIGCLSAYPAIAEDRPDSPEHVSAARTAVPRSAPRTISRSQLFRLPPGTARLERRPVVLVEAPARIPSVRWDGDAEVRLVTADAGGSYAVRDAMSKRPYQPGRRHTALGAALVLRLDGQDDSAPVSVGGGGVAAAMWKVVPK